MQPIDLEAILPHLWISGRSSRAEWWRVHITCAVLATMLEHMMFAQLPPRDGNMQPISLLWPIASLALAWVSFASTVRRFHDRGKSGWWALLYFMPFIGWLWIIVECGMLPGKPAVTYTFNPAPAPEPTPAARAPRTRLQAAPRVGTVQRTDSPTWDGKRALKLAGRAISLITAAFILYKVAFDSGFQGVFTQLGPNQSLPAIDKP
jgi:uncharacterized membrane protein YhaH (DUF805 family)